MQDVQITLHLEYFSQTTHMAGGESTRYCPPNARTHAWWYSRFAISLLNPQDTRVCDTMCVDSSFVLEIFLSPPSPLHSPTPPALSLPFNSDVLLLLLKLQHPMTRTYVLVIGCTIPGPVASVLV